MGSPLFDEAWQAILSRRTAAQHSGYMAVSGAQGIDTSSHQRLVSWAPVAASGRSFAYVKANEGTGTSYPTVDAQYSGANAAGLVTGLYSYCLPNLSPIDSANAFAAQVNRLGAVHGHLPPALDLEVGSGDLSGWCQQFIAQLRKQTGCQRVCVYSNVVFFVENIQEHWMDDDTILWLAQFNNTPGRLSYRSPRLAIHQYSQTGQVSGVYGDVDLDFAMVPLSQIITEVPDLTDEEHQMLLDCQAKVDWMYGQFAGLDPTTGAPAVFPSVPGWPSLPGGTGQKLSFLDFSREAQVQLVALATSVQNVLTAIQAIPASGAVTPVSVDAKQLAGQIVSEFLAKLSAQPASDV